MRWMLPIGRLSRSEACMHEIAQRAVANLTLCPTIVKRSTPNCLKSRAHFETDCAASVWTCVGVALVNTDRYRGHTRRRESTGLYARALSASACSLCRPCQRSATHYRPAAIGADGICVDSVRTNTHAVCLLQPTSLFACMIVTRQVSSLHAPITARPQHHSAESYAPHSIVHAMFGVFSVGDAKLRHIISNTPSAHSTIPSDVGFSSVNRTWPVASRCLRGSNTACAQRHR